MFTQSVIAPSLVFIAIVFSSNLYAYDLPSDDIDNLPFNKTGVMTLDNYQKKLILRRNEETRLYVDKVSNMAFKLTTTRTDNDFYNYDLTLQPGKIGTIDFFSNYKALPQGECKIMFEPVSAFEATLTETVKTPYYGSGIDKDGYMAVNFSHPRG